MKDKSAILKIKETVKKLLMFSGDDDGNRIDFEWPNRQNLKATTDVKQLRLKEIRYH